MILPAYHPMMDHRNQLLAAKEHAVKAENELRQSIARGDARHVQEAFAGAFLEALAELGRLENL